jgi:SAM-dependent methyltransferase
VPVLVAQLQPRSVVDIGCANGLWLEAFSRCGVAVVRGVDGPWVPADKLRIPAAAFTRLDLGTCALPYAFVNAGRFDLLICFELLEHLPAGRADALVDAMCAMSDALLVSAAVPHQGGTGHINERWPDHWRERFAARGYVACDFVRLAHWNDERIAPWYRQNIVGYFRGGAPDSVREHARQHAERLVDEPLPLCHPGVFSYKLGKLRWTLRNPVAAGWRELQRRFG